MSDRQKQTELAEFLRTRRQRAHAADFEILAGRRRRTPGLRREEVAQLAHVSVAWYTFLEQGRPVRASTEVLDNLSKALHLDVVERHHLYLLARGHPPADTEITRFGVDTHLQQVLDAMAYPAYASLSDWTVAASNAAARVAFLNCTAHPDGELNILKMVFCDPVHRQLLINWEQQAQDTLALFRASTAHSAGENWHKQLVNELSESSREFRMWWPNHDVRAAHGGPKEFNHPVVGRMVFQPMTMRYEGEAPLRMIVKVPLAIANTAEKLHRLLADEGVKPKRSRNGG